MKKVTFGGTPLSARRRSHGQAILEYLGYIALAALALGGIVYFITKGRQNTVVQNESSSFSDWVTGTQKLYSSDPSGFTNVTAAALINNGIVDSKKVVNGAITSGFGTPVTVAPANLYGTNDGVAFTYGVPPENCSAFAQSVAPSLAKMTVAGTVVMDVTAGTALNAATLGTQCKSTGGSNVPMVLTASR